ncbi:MAG TPA: hypothetical protein VJZ26_03160 [Blastocatellia bacterium]|nr:hypothetical protein [Blastocatellia bacterium]
MRLRPNERQEISDILQDEIKKATRRISERLAEFECLPASSKKDSMDGIRRFYADLADKDWTDADEEALAGYADMGEGEIKEMMREAFRRSRVHPVPSFASLINSLKKENSEPSSQPAGAFNNIDAVPAVERERIANMLHQDLIEAADEIARRLKLADTKADIVREQLEIVEGTIIARFTPLV